jgi:type IV pilus assembly protein PilM
MAGLATTRGGASLFKLDQRRLTGLDIGSSSVKLVEFSGVAPHLELERIALASIVEDDPDSTCERAISMILDSNTLECRRVATSVSGPTVAVRSLRFPNMAPDEIAGAVRYEGSQVIAFDIDDCYVDYSILASEDGNADTMDVLFVAAGKKMVDSKTRMIEAAGLEPRFVGVDMLVLLEALLRRRDLPETVALVDVGSTCTGIGITRGGDQPFVRDLDIAGHTYTEAISAELGIPIQEAETAKVAESRRSSAVERIIQGVTGQLVGELKRSLVYYQTRGHGSKIEKILLCGGSARVPGLLETVKDALGMPVELWSPISDVKVDGGRFDLPSVEQLAPIVALAAALAMKEDVQ